MVRDTSAPRDSARRLALMNLMVTLGPGLAPIVGGVLVHMAGWRSVFFALTALGVANLLFAWRLLPETRPAILSVDVKALARDYGALLKSPTFLGYAIGGGCATTSVYAFIAAAPFILVGQLGRPSSEVGFYLAVLVIGIWLGSALASRLVSRISLPRLLFAANALGTAAALGVLAVAVAGHLTVAWLVGLMSLFTISVGVAAPAALAQALSVNPRVIGSASGLYGFIQMAVGAICTALAGLGANPSLAASGVLAGASLLGQVSFWVARRGRPA